MPDFDHITTDNIFEALGFTRGEAKALQLRTELMLAIRKKIKHNSLTEHKAASLFGTNNLQIQKVLRGKIESLTIDNLLAMLSTAGVGVTFEISDHFSI